MEGKARVNVANALAATAIGYALQVPVETIRQALRTFTTSFYQTPGRLNVFDEHPFRVIMDYGHNPAALEHMADLVGKLRPAHQRVIGVLSGPGDRRDQDITQLGELASRMFDELVIKEDRALRGRRPGEAPALVRGGALSGGLQAGYIHLLGPEMEAVDYALGLAQPNDLVVIFADQVTAVWKQIIYWGKE